MQLHVQVFTLDPTPQSQPVHYATGDQQPAAVAEAQLDRVRARDGDYISNFVVTLEPFPTLRVLNTKICAGNP